MTTRLNYQQPSVLGSTVTDLATIGGREGAPFFDGQQSLIELGHRCYNGEASQGQFTLQLVELATWLEDFPSAHCLVTLVEDGYTPDLWLTRGRVAVDEGGRGVVKAEGELSWTVTVDDGNMELRGQAFTESWVRPEETDIARLVALQAYTLNGSSSTATYHRDTCNVTVNTGHLAPNANTVTMPAKKYLPGTQPQDVIQDCADTAGKQYGVVIHHTGGSHLCLLYLVNDDHTTYLSTAKISDQLADWVPDSTTVPVLEPHWEQGAGQIIEMQTVLSGMVGTWGPENVTFVEYAGIEENTDYWVEQYSDGTSTTQTQAANRTAGILEGRRNSHVTHRVSVILNPDQVHLIAAGMSIAIKSAVTFNRGDPGGDPDAYETRRIADCRFEPRIDGRYFAHLDLERPPLLVAPGRGKVGPIPPVQSEPATGVLHWDFDTPGGSPGYDVTSTYPSGPRYGAGYIYSGSLDPGVGNDSSPPLPTLTPGTYTVRADIRNLDNVRNPSGIVFRISYDAAQVSSWTSGNVSADEVAVTIEHTFVVASTGPFSFEVPNSLSAIGDVLVESGSGGTGFVGTPPPPASGTTSGGGGTIGTSPIYSPSDHEHAVQVAEDTPIVDSGGYFNSANVEDALQELGAGGIGSVLSPEGSPAVITNSGSPAYFAFPGVTELDTGDLLVVYRQGTDHQTTQDGVIVGKFGTVANDYSVTWGSPFTIYDDADDCRDPEVSTLSDGTLIVSFFIYDGSVGTGVWVTTSTDDGVTWDTPVNVPTTFSNESAVSAKVVELASGDLVLPVYGNDSAGDYSSELVYSTDGGATWGSQVTIATGSSKSWAEPYIVRLADGTLHCLIRVDDLDEIWRTVSEDGGATWSAAAKAFDGDARPAHIQVQSGGLLYVSRADPNGDTIYRQSSNYGETWNAETVLDTVGSMNLYASIVQLDNYRYGVAYAIENSSSDADIKWHLFTDDVNLDIIAGLGGGGAIGGGPTDHGTLTGLGDDDHPQYLTAEDGAVGPILIADDHSTPLVFADLIQTEDGDDLVYADIGE